MEVGEELTVEVMDDGIGYRPGPHTGVGVPTMSERAAELGGYCHIAAAAAGGTRVSARLPMAAA
jgi:signal transduction histidine kinase